MDIVYTLTKTVITIIIIIIDDAILKLSALYSYAKCPFAIDGCKS